jgi:hypothetical protein
MKACPELIDELYRTSLELEQRDLKKSPEYRNGSRSAVLGLR